MLALDEFVPDEALAVGADQLHLQALDLVDARGHVAGSGYGPTETARPASAVR